MPGEVPGDDEEHLGCDVQADGIQPISWIEVNNGDLRGEESPKHGIGDK